MKSQLTKPWLAFEHQLRKNLQKQGVLQKLKDQKILIACSGGADSVALALFLLRQRKSAGLNLHLLHIHHGKQQNVQFRNQAAQFVRNFAESFALEYTERIIELGPKEKESETLFRQKRIQIYQEELVKTKSQYLALGHHQDDLLETRLIRMIRGTGVSGLQSMRILGKKIFRPFLQTKKSELRRYLQEFEVFAIEDPTNQVPNNVRNWLRLKWLKVMQEEHPEWLNSLSRSLEQIAKEGAKKKVKHNYSNGINRLHYKACLSDERSQLLIQYMQSLGVSDFRHSQIQEIKQQLDRSQNVHTFIIAGLVWTLNAEQIIAKKK